jgi:acyl dehydratase
MTAGASQMANPLNAVGAQSGVALAGVARLAGDRLGVSRWHTVTQEQVRHFADDTRDHRACVAEIVFRYYSLRG